MTFSSVILGNIAIALGLAIGIFRFDLFYTVYGSLQLFLVLQITYVFLTFKWVNKMVDIITNRVFDTYYRYSPLNNNQNESLATLSALKRFSKDQKYKREQNRETDKKIRESQLFAIKESTAEVYLPKRRPLMGMSCASCTLTSRESLVKKTTELYALRNILDYQVPKKTGFLPKTFSHLYQVYELKKFDYPQVANLVLKDERLTHAVEKMTLQQFQDSEESDDEFYKKLLKSNEQRASKLLFDMRSTLSDFLLRFTSWVLYKILPCFLTSVIVHPGQVEMLKKASKSNLPLIFLPLHRSHLDYILISFILLNNNIRSPLVAAGDNLRIPFFGSLLRGLGAFFIKRRIDPVMGRKDLIYKTVLHTYMNMCLKAGHNIEFFLEGGRTRTGKPCMPKYGVLSVILETFMDGTIEDALLVPVSVNYEKLVDGNFVREQLGQPKQMETFTSAIKAIYKILNSNYGVMRIDFNQPFSLRELVKTLDMTGKALPENILTSKKQLKSNPSTNSLYGTDVVSDEHKNLVEIISKHIIYDCAQSTCVMSTNALAFLLLTKYRDGATVEELVNALDELKKELECNNRDIGFSGDSIDVITYAVGKLGPGLVRKERINNEDVIKPIVILPNVIELSYYSNTLVTHFAMESIIAIGIATVNKAQDNINHDDLRQNILELCDIFQYEFLLCKPCQNIDEVILSYLDNLTYRKNIFLMDEEDDMLKERSRRLARHLVDDDVENEFVPEKIYKLNPNVVTDNTLKTMALPIIPLIETYAITAFTLDKLVGRQMVENELIHATLDELKNQLKLGLIKYEESVSVDSIKNALKLFQKWGILEYHAEKKLRLYYLKESADDSETVKVVYQRINKFQKKY